MSTDHPTRVGTNPSGDEGVTWLSTQSLILVRKSGTLCRAR